MCASVTPCVTHLVSEQVVFEIDVRVGRVFRKQLLDKLHFLKVFTNMTLEVNMRMSDI